MKRSRGLRWIAEFAVIAVLVSAFYRQQVKLDGYRSDLEDQERVIHDMTADIKEFKDKLAYYEQPGDGILRHGKLQVKDGRLLNENGEQIQLRGVSSHGLTWFPRYTNGASLRFWKEAGANVFRASMYSDQHRGYIYYPEESSNYLYLAVENALANDMYAIIDWHILYDANPLEHMEAAKDFFEAAAAHYEENPGIIYEICNEPNGETTWEDVTEYAHEIIPVIREYAPEAIILVGMPNYCTDFKPVLEDPLPYENIMYTYHQYVNGEGKAYDAYALEKMLERRLPIFVSEWGVGLKARDAEGNDFRASEEFLDRLEEAKVSWVVWALSNKNDSHGLIRHDSRVYGDFTRQDLSEVGAYVYDRLKKQTPRILRQR